MGKSKKVDVFIFDPNNLCQHKKDCCHPHCDCGLAPSCSNMMGKVFDISDEPVDLLDIIEKCITEVEYINGKQGPLARYNTLITKRNRKVERGIPLH